MLLQIRNFDKSSENHGFETDHIRLLYYDLQRGFSDTYRSYEAPRFCTIVSGEKHVRLNRGNAIHYDSKSFILLPPHSKVDMYMPTHTRAIVMEINPHTAAAVAAKVSDKLKFELKQEHFGNQYLCHGFSTRMSVLHNHIQEVMAGPDPSKVFLVDLVVQELVYEILKVKGTFELLSYQQNHPVRLAMRQMQQQPEQIKSVCALAASFNMSPPNFNAHFKKLTGETPSEFLTRCRIERAKYLLGHLSVTETAFELGYENISHFIRLFKERYGTTPKQYQVNLLRESR
jgi:AraC-like DNA-binding protein